MNDKYKKINEVEIIAGLCLSLLVYGLCLALDLLAIGVAISPIIQSFFTFGMWWFFKNHGDPHADKFKNNVSQYLATIIPFVPTTVAVFAIKVFLHNRAAGL